MKTKNKQPEKPAKVKAVAEFATIGWSHLAGPDNFVSIKARREGLEVGDFGDFIPWDQVNYAFRRRNTLPPVSK